MSSDSLHDPPAPHIDSTRHRRERSREMSSLFTHEPLPPIRPKKKPSGPVKKRKRHLPETPPLSFDPNENKISSGRMDIPASQDSESRQPESSPISHHEPQMFDSHVHDEYVDPQKRARMSPVFSPAGLGPSRYPNTACTDANDTCPGPLDSYDSSGSCPSSSSPTPSDRSSGPHAFSFQPPSFLPHSPVYSTQPAAHPESYSYPVDFPVRFVQGQIPDATHGRGGPHGLPQHYGPAFPRY